MTNTAAFDRAFKLLDRLNASSTPARAMTRAAAKIHRLACAKQSRALYWLSSAVVEHKHAILALPGDIQKAAEHAVRRDHALALFARRSAQQL